MMRIGFIGLGQMGLPMFVNLSRTYSQAVGFDSFPGLNERLRNESAQLGISIASSLEELAHLDIVITMLPNGKAVRSCLLGDGSMPALASQLNHGAVVIDMSSSSPLDTLALAEDLSAQGIHLVDAPVSGSVPKAKAASLAIMVGAEDSIAERVTPILETMGAKLIRTGAVGSAHGMKSLNNYVYAAGLLAASEALLLGQAMNLDLGVLVDVLNASSGRNVATETKLKQHMLDGGDFKAGFGLHLMAKDLGIAHGLKDSAGFTPPQLELCHKLWQEACQQLPATADNTEIYHFLESRLQST